MSKSIEAVQAGIVEMLPRLRRFARALARSPHDGDDLVQTAVERALARCDQLHADATLAPWLFGILRNAWIDEVRARNRQERLFAPEELGAEIGDAGGGAHEQILSVQESMSRLPEEQRSAVALVLIEGLSYKEAAAAMGVPIGTLTSRLARGREALQALLCDAI
ncbi:MAG TPA: sigma-70 family RNA polymerase sigma factor [Steroidobacteraceae bacterium]|nr:sigma-70 family RNA polymerase sigma factor [Steroidobacteraceae bacterium]